MHLYSIMSRLHYIKCAWLSGDITDAKEKDLEGSRQFEDEWKQYDRVLRETGVLEDTVWLDTRGNHGLYYTFSVFHIQSVYVSRY